MKLTLKNVTVEYEMPEGNLLPALGPVTIDVETGSFVCLLGPSGCGKSTLVRVLAGLIQSTGGIACMDGNPIEHPLPQIGIMFQDSNLMPWRTVLGNVALPLELRGISKDLREQTALHVLERLGLKEFVSVYPGELSGGMSQRVALGRVLIQQPEVLLLDEPFGALDALTREQISLDLLQLWERERQTVLMVTHDINEAVLLADRIVVLSRRPGRVVADIVIDLERPRGIEAIYSSHFAQLARTVRDTINHA